MSVNNKDFIVENGIYVNGTATFSSGITINDTPITIDESTHRLKAFVDNAWVSMALLSDIQTGVFSSPPIQYNGGN